MRCCVLCSTSQFADLLPRWNEYVKLIQFTMKNALMTRTGMTPLHFFFGRHLRVPASLNVPQTSLDPRSLEFVTAFENRVHQALDQGREGQVQLTRDMAPRRDPAVHFQVGVQAWLRADECPIPGDKHFKLLWTGPFTILAVTPSTATLDLPEHCDCCPLRSILISCARFSPGWKRWGSLSRPLLQR